MSSIKNLKKDINYVLGDVIGECYSWELLNPKADTKGTEAIIDEAILSFDNLIAKVHTKNIDNKKKHYKDVMVELEKIAIGLLDKVNKL